MSSIDPNIPNLPKAVSESREPVLIPGLEYHLGLIAKQLKRIEELGRFLPFPEQREELNRLVSHLNVAARYVRWHLSGRTAPEDPTATRQLA
jgi:hypothetical protein